MLCNDASSKWVAENRGVEYWLAYCPPAVTAGDPTGGTETRMSNAHQGPGTPISILRKPGYDANHIDGHAPFTRKEVGGALWTGPLCLVVLLLFLRLLPRDCGLSKRRRRRRHCQHWGTEAGASAGASAGTSTRTPPCTPKTTPRMRMATPRVTGAHKDARRRRTTSGCSRVYIRGGSCGSGRPLFVLFLACVAGASARPGPSDEARPPWGLSLLCSPLHQERNGDPPFDLPQMSAKDDFCSGASSTPVPSSLRPSSSIFYPLGEASCPASSGTPVTPRTNRMSERTTTRTKLPPGTDDCIWWSRAPSPNGGGSRTRAWAPMSPFSSTSFGVASHPGLGNIHGGGNSGCGPSTPGEKGPRSRAKAVDSEFKSATSDGTSRGAVRLAKGDRCSEGRG